MSRVPYHQRSANLFARATAVFGSVEKMAGLSWDEAKAAMAKGEMVRRAAWRETVIGLHHSKRATRGFNRHFVIVRTDSGRRIGTKWCPYVEDFDANDWEIVIDRGNNDRTA